MKRCEVVVECLANGERICDIKAFTRLGRQGHYLCLGHFNRSQTDVDWIPKFHSTYVMQPDEIHPAE